jgi:hypothetical protein
LFTVAARTYYDCATLDEEEVTFNQKIIYRVANVLQIGFILFDLGILSIALINVWRMLSNQPNSRVSEPYMALHIFVLSSAWV